MAHTLQERYSSLVDLKMRATLVTRDRVIFNNRYEGDPKSGLVKIPVRDAEVVVGEYDKANGMALNQGTTTYLDLPIDKDYAVNELIDGYDALAVPDGIVAERLDSAGYSLAMKLDKDSIATLEAKGTDFGDTTALDKTTVYDGLVDIRTKLSKANVPTQGRWALVAPEVFANILKAPEFIKASNLGDAVVQTGAVGSIAGFLIFECNNLSENVEVIAGHPDWCHRVNAWKVGVHLQDLAGSGKYIGASAVQGRNVYGLTVSKAAAVIVKKKA